MVKYEDFIFELKEGLITSHDITQYSTVITNYLTQINIKYSIKIIDKLEFELTLDNVVEDVVEMINHKCYVLGYFPAYYFIMKNGMKNGFKKIPKLENIEKIIILYQSKYDDGIYKNTLICPDKLYHLSRQENKKSIFKKGLYPKSKNRISVHPERIYLFDDINNYEDLLKSLKYSDTIKKDYILLEINCINDELILHIDPKYRLGFFTYDNINPKNIKIIKENI